MSAWVQDDGGRAAAGYRGEAGDCVVRAARAKDDEEAALRDAVCSGRMTLDQARRHMLERWGPRP